LTSVLDSRKIDKITFKKKEFLCLVLNWILLFC
jgi:hypothetical protein